MINIQVTAKKYLILITTFNYTKVNLFGLDWLILKLLI